jgi:hypothetical protein
MGLWKSNTIIYYHITHLFEQKYRLAIPFAENNFGPFEHILFVIVLFESPPKTLWVLFARLYLQMCIFYHDISISCPTVSSKWANPNRKYDLQKRQNNATFLSYDPASARNGHAWVWRHPGHRSFLLANYCAMYTRVRVKPDIWKNS